MKWFVTLLAATGVPVLVYYSVTRKRPDILFTISEPIALGETQGTPPTRVQQLDLRNNGNVAARDIVVKVRTTISNYDVHPFAATDVYSVSQRDEAFELTYQRLPPEGEI